MSHCCFQPIVKANCFWPHQNDILICLTPPSPTFSFCDFQIMRCATRMFLKIVLYCPCPSEILLHTIKGSNVPDLDENWKFPKMRQIISETTPKQSLAYSDNSKPYKSTDLLNEIQKITDARLICWPYFCPVLSGAPIEPLQSPTKSYKPRPWDPSNHSWAIDQIIETSFG